MKLVSLAALATVVVFSGSVGTAHADSPAAALALTPAPMPGTGAVLVKKVKRASAGRAVFHDRDGAWTVHYAVVLGRSLPSSELTLRISDVSRRKQPLGTRHKVIYSEAAVARGSFTLTRDEVVTPNARLMLEIESDGQAVAKKTFYIQGPPTRGGATTKIDLSAADASADEERLDTATITARRH